LSRNSADKTQTMPLNKDAPLHAQPEGTYTYALNTVADAGAMANEAGNRPCGKLPEGYLPIGHADMGEGGTVLFLAHPDGTSEIGVLDRDCNYLAHVNDHGSQPRHMLGFRATHPVQATYRLRRGCQRTVYFTDDLNRPRYFDLDKHDAFKNPDGTWNGELFSLQRTVHRFPIFDRLEVLEHGGSLKPGSYNIAVQYMDEGRNATEWLVTSPVMQVYHDTTTKSYRDIRGSTGTATDYTDRTETTKAIEVVVGEMDMSFPYYRLAVIAATSGNGAVTSVVATDVLPTGNPRFVYTGQNASGECSEEEILFFTDHIARAKAITAMGDRLHLANTAGKAADLCGLQRYASRIKADCTTKPVSFLDSKYMSPDNLKGPAHEFYGLGYMPGEIYSFGIVYLFADGTQSPVYHIPGKSPKVDAKAVFAPGPDVYPMSADNATETSYVGNSSCGGGYWGRDSEGMPLEGMDVRHHRFPLRSELGLPLLETNNGEEHKVDYHKLELKVTGKLKVPVPCPEGNPGCGTENLPSFAIRVGYMVDGAQRSFSTTINPVKYGNGGDASVEVEIVGNSDFSKSAEMVVTSISITDANGDWHTLSEDSPNATYGNEHGGYFEGQGKMGLKVVLNTETTKGRNHFAKVLGIKFSGIDIPNPEDTGGEEVIGYHIVRNKRGEHDRTILDTGVLTPTTLHEKYVAHGVLMPENGNLAPDIFGLIHPEHKFNGREYAHFTDLLVEGHFHAVDKKHGKVNFNDVEEGTSYDPEHHSKDNDDAKPEDHNPRTKGLDGWCLSIISRDSILEYGKAKDPVRVGGNGIRERFYLSALESMPVNDGNNEVFNVTTDNKIGILQTLEHGTISADWGKELPYVALYRANANAYSDFRTRPYHRDMPEHVLFSDPGSSSCYVFGGDSYISPMRYVNTFFYRNRAAKRDGKSSWLSWIIGGAIAVFGAVLAFATFGTSLLLVGTGLGLMGAGMLVANAGLKQHNYNKAYQEAYDDGLRQAVGDRWIWANYEYNADVSSYYKYVGGAKGGKWGKDGPSDDTIEWVGECLTDLWFESAVNTNLRYGISSGDTPDFLAAPGMVEDGHNDRLWTTKPGDYEWVDSTSERYPKSSLERHLARKLLAFDQDRDDNRRYIGLALGEMYAVNPDYQRGNLQKAYHHLPLEYDCCSKCREEFPHRWHWSRVSFQEDLADNYRTFLPNDYKDLPGEGGGITNIFAMGQNLFIHSRDALWLQPAGDREQVSGDIVSHIGTGEVGSLPARKVSGAGLRHQWGALLTDMGYFFVSEGEGKVFHFTGEQAKPISSLGLSKWFRENVPILMDRAYRRDNGEAYPFADNPANPFGTGFALGHDRLLDRVLLTKRDFVLDGGLTSAGSALHLCGSGLVHFPNYLATIAQREGEGWRYEGFEGCRMKFGKRATVLVKEERVVSSVIPSDADIHVFLDTSGSFNNAGLQNIRDAVDEWLVSFGMANPNWAGMRFFHSRGDERWLGWVQLVHQHYVGQGIDPATKSVIYISFCNESNNIYHGWAHNDSFTISAPTTAFMDDHNQFKLLYPKFKSFAGIVYPIVYHGGAQYRVNLLHSIAALHGVPMTTAEVAAELAAKNPAFSDAQWDAMRHSLMAANPYPDDGLKNWNWRGKWDRASHGGADVIDAVQFEADISELLASIPSTVTEEVEVLKDVTVHSYVDGIPVDGGVERDASWTISWQMGNSVAREGWSSWHSYLPGMYIGREDGLLSAPISPKNGHVFWKHGEKGYYHNFYGRQCPHEIELVSLPGTLQGGMWDSLVLVAEGRLDVGGDWYEARREVHDKLVAYNHRQCSGLVPIFVKDLKGFMEDYLMEQIRDGNLVFADRNEMNWTLNNLRDIRVNYDAPIWDTSLAKRQAGYWRDAVLNLASMDAGKDWAQLEPFRGRYLVVRLVYDRPNPIKLLTWGLANSAQRPVDGPREEQKG